MSKLNKDGVRADPIHIGNHNEIGKEAAIVMCGTYDEQGYPTGGVVALGSYYDDAKGMIVIDPMEIIPLYARVGMV